MIEERFCNSMIVTNYKLTLSTNVYCHAKKSDYTILKIKILCVTLNKKLDVHVLWYNCV
jgi:hypothetical protein